MNKKYEQLKQRLYKISDLGGAVSLMNWDQQVNMPPGAAADRSQQMATISGMLHEMQIDEELGELLEDLNDEAQDWDYDSHEASVVRVNWRDYQKAVKVPTELMMEFMQARGMAQPAWQQARAESDFEQFAPHLEKLRDLVLQLAEALGYESGNPYDAMLDNFETDLTAEQVTEVFSNLKPHLLELVEAIGEAKQVDDEVLYRHYPKDAQLAFSKELSAELGFDFQRGRLDLSTHPFTGGMTRNDVRLTTRVDEDFLTDCLFSIIHEAGHGIHAQQLAPDLSRLGTGMSLSTAESQSRFYENLIGRSRAFWEYALPKAKVHFPEALGAVDVETFYQAINKVQPSLIRVDADEVTYGMHIMIRFEIENALINGEISIGDLPGVWNAKIEEYLGITPPNDAKGVLQDIHWSWGMFGYFPTYLLGSMLSSQLWEAMLEDIPDAEDKIREGEIAPITDWLAESIQQHGGKFTYPEITERATGQPPTSEPFISYLTDKYTEIYSL